MTARARARTFLAAMVWAAALYLGSAMHAAPAAAQLLSSCAGQLGDDSLAKDFIACLKALENEIERTRKISAVPEGAVMAFDLAGGCPPGWSPYKDGQGRFVLGAKPGTRPPAAPRRPGEHFHGEKGGAERHALTADELPAHAHTLKGLSLYYGTKDGARVAVDNRPDKPWNQTDDRYPFQTNEAGGGKPHNNMPPYIALHLCRKD